MDQPEVLLENRLFQVVRLYQKTPEGQSRPREIIRHPGAVVILPVLGDGRVVLIRNYRIAVEDRLVELPAGTLDPGEDPRDAALRELAEETGYRAGAIELLTSFFSSPGILDERMHLYLATKLEPGPTALEQGEDILPLEVPWEEAVRMARDGRIRDGKTLLGLLFYDRFSRRGNSPRPTVTG